MVLGLFYTRYASVSLSLCHKMTMVYNCRIYWIFPVTIIVSHLTYFFFLIKRIETDIPIAEAVIGSYYMNIMNYKNFPVQQDTY